MNDCWYSPGYVIIMAERLVVVYGQPTIDADTRFKKVGEMKATAIMLLALRKAFGTHFFMQPSKEDSPDVWTLYQEKIQDKNVDTKYQTVEVITYETHSNMSVANFILSKKLINPKKAYDSETIILCYIRKAGAFVDFNELYKEFNQYTFKPTRVFIVGNTLNNSAIFMLSQVWPDIHHEAVNYVERANAYPLPNRIFFKRGTTKEINYSGEMTHSKVDPYEVFNLDEKYLKNKYNK